MTNQYGLGRYVWHDPRSRAFPITHLATPQAISHPRYGPWLDQGQLGSCTGNAGTGMLGCGPFSPSQGPAQGFDEAFAIQLYSDATKVDDVPAEYPPTDTGSSGLAIAKVLKARGLIDRYEHAFSVREALVALQRAPVLIGSLWLTGMFNPDSHGRVRLSGAVAGGHEYLLREYVPGRTFNTGTLVCDNSWGLGWGDHGRFRLSVAQLSTLLSKQGDVTAPVPRTG